MTNDATMTAATGMTMAMTTTETAPRTWRWVRSAGAVLGGMLASAALALATDEVLHLTGLFPPINQVTYAAPRFVAATSYRVIYAILGFYLIARRRRRDDDARDGSPVVSSRAGRHHAALRVARWRAAGAEVRNPPRVAR